MIGKVTSVFPDNYQNIELEKLIEVYGKGPVRLETILADLGDHDLSAYPIDNKWSIKEIVFHITDSEIIGAARIKMILGEGNRDLPFYDQDSWVLNMAYNSLSEKQKAVAIFRQEPLPEIVTLNSTAVEPLSPVGIKFGELNPSQQIIFLDLVDEYLSTMPPEQAKRRS